MSLLIVCEPLRVTVSTSYQALKFLAVAHVLALWGILQSGFYVLLVGVIVSAVYYLRSWLRHRNMQVLQFQDERCWLGCGQGVGQSYGLGKRHFVSCFLVVVQLQTQQKLFTRSRYIAIFSDAVSADDFRRLRVLLNLNQRATPASSVASE